jgi:hypothetical protein
MEKVLGQGSERVVGLRPLEQALAALRKEFGHLALFFVDALHPASAAGGGGGGAGGGAGVVTAQTVCVVWKSEWFQPKSFRPVDSRHRRRVEPEAPAAAVAVVAAASTQPSISAKRTREKKKSDGGSSDSSSSSLSDSDSEEEEEKKEVMQQGKSWKKAQRGVSVPDMESIVAEMLEVAQGVLEKPVLL